MTIIIVWKDYTKQEAHLLVIHQREVVVDGYYAATSEVLKWWLAAPPGTYEDMMTVKHLPAFDGDWNTDNKPVQQ